MDELLANMREAVAAWLEAETPEPRAEQGDQGCRADGLRPLTGKEMCRLLERAGWQLLRVRGSHHVYGKSGSDARLSVPVHGNDKTEDRAAEPSPQAGWDRGRRARSPAATRIEPPPLRASIPPRHRTEIIPHARLRPVRDRRRLGRGGLRAAGGVARGEGGAGRAQQGRRDLRDPGLRAEEADALRRALPGVVQGGALLWLGDRRAEARVRAAVRGAQPGDRAAERHLPARCWSGPGCGCSRRMRGCSSGATARRSSCGSARRRSRPRGCWWRWGPGRACRSCPGSSSPGPPTRCWRTSIPCPSGWRWWVPAISGSSSPASSTRSAARPRWSCAATCPCAASSTTCAST